MDNIDMELLISLVENRPVLWDKTQVCYKNRQSTFSAWKEICIMLYDDFESLSDEDKNDFGKGVIKKWNNARDNWIKYHKKIKEFKSDSDVKSLRKYKFYDHMLFLKKIVSCRPPESRSQSFQSEEKIAPIPSHNEQSDSQSNSESNAVANINTKISKKRKTNGRELDRQMINIIKSIEHQDKSKSMCFFKSIAPIVDKYCDTDYVDFQYEVIKIMKNISRQNAPVNEKQSP